MSKDLGVSDRAKSILDIQKKVLRDLNRLSKLVEVLSEEELQEVETEMQEFLREAQVRLWSLQGKLWGI